MFIQESKRRSVICRFKLWTQPFWRKKNTQSHYLSILKKIQRFHKLWKPSISIVFFSSFFHCRFPCWNVSKNISILQTSLKAKVLLLWDHQQNPTHNMRKWLPSFSKVNIKWLPVQKLTQKPSWRKFLLMLYIAVFNSYS